MTGIELKRYWRKMFTRHETFTREQQNEFNRDVIKFKQICPYWYKEIEY